MVMGSLRMETEVAVVGAGPGGYVAAIHAADLGRDVTLVEERERLGGVCLTEGCIPSKTIIHAVELLESVREARRMGIVIGEARIDPRALRQWMESVVEGLSRGVKGLLEKRGVNVIRGRARFDGPRSLAVEGSDVAAVDFRHCIVATGSRPTELALARGLDVWSSAEALRLTSVPETLLVVGGGYIGLELGAAFAGLGSRVTLVEYQPRLLSGADEDLVAVVARQASKRFESILLGSKVAAIRKTTAGFAVTIERDGEASTSEYAQVLVAAGRRPRTDGIGLERAGIDVDDRGFIRVDGGMRTAVPHIHAIGDVTPGPMLAHRASRGGKVAAEVIAGRPSAFDNRAVPAVVFTDPEIAWTGLTEREASAAGRRVTVGRFPLSALGRARTLGRSDGFAKILSDPDSGLVLGAAVVGPSASELVSEATLAIEMGATIEDVLVTIHPHPTMSEALMEAAEAAAGMPVHIAPASGGAA